MIGSLRLRGRAQAPLVLPAAHLATIGTAPGCDLQIPGELSARVDSKHAAVERRGDAILVHDLASTHGVRRSPRHAPVRELQVAAGSAVWIGDVALLAMDRALDELRTRLAWGLGLEAHAAIDDAIEAVASGGPLLLMGPPGSEGERLATEIHRAGPPTAVPPVSVVAAPLPPLAGLAGTIVIDLDRVGTVPARYVEALIDPASGVRPILLARSERRALACLDIFRDRVRGVTLRPLAERRDEIPRLLAMLWRECGSLRTVDELGAALDDVVTYRWPRGVAELRAHAPRLLAYLEHGQVSAAARALGVTRQTLGEHFARIGFPALNVTDGWAHGGARAASSGGNTTGAAPLASARRFG